MTQPFDVAAGRMLLAPGHLGAAQRTASRLGDLWSHGMGPITSGAPYEIVDGVARIGLRGLIVPELFGIVGHPCATGCAELRALLRLAAEDPKVRGVALEIDSPGGYVTGVDDTGAAIRAARAVKPVAAIVEGAAFSAAYWLAAQADSIAVTPTGGVGHIGVLAVHLDMSGALAKAGIAPTIIAEGAEKADGHPMQPLGDRAEAGWRRAIEGLRRRFAEQVAQGRAGRVSVEAALATQSHAYDHPDDLAEALSLGLIDAILPAQDAHAAFAASLADPAATGGDPR